MDKLQFPDHLNLTAYVIYVKYSDNEYLSIHDIFESKEQAEEAIKSFTNAELWEVTFSAEEVQLAHMFLTLVDVYCEHHGAGGLLHVQLEDQNFDMFAAGKKDAEKYNDYYATFIANIGERLGAQKVELSYELRNDINLKYEVIAQYIMDTLLKI